MAKLTGQSLRGEAARSGAARIRAVALVCACALFGAAVQAQTLNLPATLSSGAYAASSAVTNCTGTVSQANCTSVTLANNATVTLAAATQIVLGPGFTAVAGNASTSLVAAIVPAPTVSAVAVSPASVISGGSATITVTLSSNALYAVAVALTSSNTAAFNPPASITVAAGQINGSAAVTAGTVSASTPVTVTGSYGVTQTGSVTVLPLPDFTITLTPTSSPATAMVGGATTFTVSVSPTNSFNGVVTLTALGLPTGASASFSPATITGAGTSTMTVTAPGSGTGNFTVTANGASGSLSHSAVSTLAVQDFTVTLSGYNYASPPTIPSGGTQTFTIGTAGINGFTGNIALTYGQYTPDGGCGLNNLSMPSQVTAGSAVSIVLTPYTANCFFQITANASGDAHVLLGAVFVSSAANFGFTLPVSQGTLTATPGTQSASVVFTPSLTIVNNFCGTVIFQVTGLPNGATYTAPSVYLCANSPQTAQITVTVPPGSPQSTSQLTIDAFGSNGNAGQASSQYIYPYLQVGSGGSTFSISASPPQTTAPGGTAQYTITVNGSSGLGNVTLTATGGPPGSTALFNGSTSAVVAVGGSATMAVATPTNEGLGTYAVPITGMLGTVPKYSSASLTVAALSPSHMLAPANGGFIVGGNTAFTWTPGVGATQYTLTVTPANGQSTSVVVNPSATPGATVSLPTANQSITATLLTYTASGPLQLQTYSYIVNPQLGTQLPVLDTTQQQPSPYIPNNGIESQPYTYHFTGGDARAMAEGECVETEVAVRMVLLTQTTATLAFTGAQGAKPQASALNCTCPGGPVPIQPAPTPVDTTPVITGVTSPIQANLSQTIHITGMYFGDPTAGANDTVQICQNGAGGCTSADAELLDDYDILATVTLAAGNYTVFVFSNGAAGEGFSEAPGGSDESNGADLVVVAEATAPPSVALAPSKVVAGSGGQFSVTASASGGSGSGYTYSWNIVSTLAGDNPGVAQFCNAQGVCSASQQGPSCVGQATCTATLQGVTGGKATLQAMVTDSAGGQAQTPAQTRLIIVQITSVNIVATNSIGGTNITSSNSSSSPLPVGAIQWPAALWTTPTPVVLISGLPNVTVTATTTPPTTDPDVTIAFEAVRAPDDAVGGPATLPTLTGQNVAALALNQAGSFQILGYADTNGNGVRDANETGAALPIVLVQANLTANGSTPHQANSRLTGGGGGGVLGVQLITGDFNVANQGATAGMYLGGTVALVGGGSTGTRGTDRVFAGWVQNLLGYNQSAIYQNGHSIQMVLTTSATATGPPFLGLPVFVGGNQLQTINPPFPILLDTGQSLPGTGGNSSALTSSQITWVAPGGPPLGVSMLVEAVDSPTGPFPLVTPADGVSQALNITLNDSFCAYLTLWSNVTGNNGAAPGNFGTSGAFADMVYGVVLAQPWIVNETYGPGGPIGVPVLSPQQATVFQTVAPAASVGIILIAPPAGPLQAYDARH